MNLSLFAGDSIPQKWGCNRSKTRRTGRRHSVAVRLVTLCKELGLVVADSSEGVRLSWGRVMGSNREQNRLTSITALRMVSLRTWSAAIRRLEPEIVNEILKREKRLFGLVLVHPQRLCLTVSTGNKDDLL